MNTRAFSALALLLCMFFPLAAAATPMTLTFDRGYEDTSITDPTGDYHGPYAWVEEGIRADGFWAENVGTPAGAHVLGHTHRARNGFQDAGDAPYGHMAEYTHAYTGDLQGLIISLENGGTFDLVSLDYDIAILEKPQDVLLERLPWSFAVDDPRILVATAFDPSAPDFESQWTAFQTTSEGGVPDWQTLDFVGTGFTNLTSIMISQTAAQTWLDNIVIDVHDSTTPVPEPSTALLLGMGLAFFGRRARHRSVGA